MEQEPKRGRGRPPLHSEEYMQSAAALFPGVSRRALNNLSYATAGFEIAVDVLGEDAAQRIFMPETRRFYHGQGILEQIGRMRNQDGYPEQFCKDVLRVALELRGDKGVKSRDVERWIRRGRKTGAWESEQ